MFNILHYSSSSPLIQPQPPVPAALWLLMARDERRGTENPLIMTSVALLLHCCVHAAHYGAYSRPCCKRWMTQVAVCSLQKAPQSVQVCVKKLFSAATKSLSNGEGGEKKKKSMNLFFVSSNGHLFEICWWLVSQSANQIRRVFVIYLNLFRGLCAHTQKLLR